MNIASKVAWDDTILPFQLDNADIRGRIARLDGTLNAILGQHNYPVEVAALVAEAVMLTALIGQTISQHWKLSLQIRGDGPIRLIATDYFGPKAEGEPAEIRAYASYDADRLTSKEAPFAQIGKGMFAVLIDQGDGAMPYQGITPLAGGSLSACAETYFKQSEQLNTRFSLSIAEAQEPGGKKHWRAGGIMVQHMPKASTNLEDYAEADKHDSAENWNRTTILLDTVELTELIGPHVTPDQLLVRLFHEESPRVFDAQPIKFGCTCGPEKVKQTMSIYSAKDIAHMTDDDGKVTADCQFCGAHYEFAPESLGFEAKE
ncbi:MAG: Hsp33 family molecular chaperone HslO [Rhodobacteraceae bacterium]|nr:Hsp33 family molecular chaperone HslO [Paracoccaceae bacterium]